MTEPMIIVAECGCRFNVVSSMPAMATGSLELEDPCAVHSAEGSQLNCDHKWEPLPKESVLVENDYVCSKCGAEKC